jgi:creatinine amidohydrolase
MTWEAVRDLERGRTVAVLPVGAVEAHGPHLPLGTDVVIASAMAVAGAEELQAAGWGAVVMPPVWYSAAPFGRDFPGTVGLEAETVTRMLVEIAASLANQGFRALAIANAHLDPTHLRSLTRAEAGGRARGIVVVAPNLARRKNARRLTEEFQTGACHAGRFEGSVVLAEAPELVREEVARALPANPTSLSEAIGEGRTSFQEAGGPRAYFGWPAEATAEEGRATVAELGRILAEAVLEELAT